MHFCIILITNIHPVLSAWKDEGKLLLVKDSDIGHIYHLLRLWWSAGCTTGVWKLREVYIFHNLCFLGMGLGFEVANQFHNLLNVCIDSVFCVKISLLWPRNPDETCARLWQLMHHIKTNHTRSLQELRWRRRTDWKGTAASGGGRTGWSSDEQGRLSRARSYSLRHAIGSTRWHRTRRWRCRRAEAAGSGGPHLTSRSADQG
jgi:hypothetical protein